MKFASATDAAIALAMKAGTLTVTRQDSRFAGEFYFAISDDHGLIETQLSLRDVDLRLAPIADAIGVDGCEASVDACCRGGGADYVALWCSING